MSNTTVEITPGPALPSSFRANVAQPQIPTPSATPPVGLVEIEQAAKLIPGPPGPKGDKGDKGDTGAQGGPDTPAQILAKLVTVDGSGSGLDADTLDGHDTPYFGTQTDLMALTTRVTNVEGVNTSQDAAIALKAPLASPGLTGVPTAPTASLGTNSSQIASTAFVGAAVTALNVGQYAPINNPVLTGDPKAPTPVLTDNDTSIATTAFVQGQAYLKDAPNDGLTYGRKSLAWSPVVGGAVISDNFPAGPNQVGQLFWESDTGNLYIWYDDGNSQQWVQVNSTGTTRQGPVWIADAVVLSGFGSTFTATGIAVGATEVMIEFSGLSTSGTIIPEIRMGSGSLMATGYGGFGITINGTPSNNFSANSTGIKLVASWGSAVLIRGHVMLRKRSNSEHIWQAQAVLDRADNPTPSAFSMINGQSPALGGPADRIAVALGTDTFTAGNISVWYR